MIKEGWYSTTGKYGPQSQMARVVYVTDNGAAGYIRLKAIDEELAMCWDLNGKCKVKGLTDDPDFHLDLEGRCSNCGAILKDNTEKQQIKSGWYKNVNSRPENQMAYVVDVKEAEAIGWIHFKNINRWSAQIWNIYGQAIDETGEDRDPEFDLVLKDVCENCGRIVEKEEEE